MDYEDDTRCARCGEVMRNVDDLRSECLMPADEAPEGAEAVPEAMIEPAARAYYEEASRGIAEPHGDDWHHRRIAVATVSAALRADPLRAYIRDMTERVECPRCGGAGQTREARNMRFAWGACPACDGERTVPRYQAEGGAEAFIEGLRGRL